MAQTELRFYGGREEDRETGVRCRGLDPSDGQLEPPRVNARFGSGGSLMDGRERRGGSGALRRLL